MPLTPPPPASPTPSWNTVRVHGTWVNQDSTRKHGTWRVDMPVRVTNSAEDVIIPRGLFRAGALATLESMPSLDLQIPASDDDDNFPTGFKPVVTVTFDDNSPQEVYPLLVPVALSGDPDGINLRKIVLPEAIPTQQVLAAGVAGGLAQLDGDGDVVDAAGVKVASGGAGGSTQPVVGLDTDGVPYVDLDGVTSGGTVALDDDGTPYVLIGA